MGELIQQGEALFAELQFYVFLTNGGGKFQTFAYLCRQVKKQIKIHEIMKKSLSLSLLLCALALLTSCGARRNISTAATEQGVVINGVRWATRNVDAPGTFAANPEDAGMFYQWNRRKGWNAAGEVENWDNSFPEGLSWERRDAPCPRGWRLPTADEWLSLEEAGSEWITKNGVNGRVFGTAPHQIFLPAAGWRTGATGALSVVDAWGYYWSSTFRAGVWALWFNSSGSSVGVNSTPSHGFSIRCVAN